ncbi:DUF1349 domain-containing protein [Cohnella sp. GCM10012308]|uniref:beta-xylosidase family glycoside hydrolase n=1 Tax=Cohnella sp. GCM10012308 TaxID=3317329 RepID=UPI0036192C7F
MIAKFSWMKKGALFLSMAVLLASCVLWPAPARHADANADVGLFSDAFGGTLAGWTPQGGTWSIASGELDQSDTGADRQIYINQSLDQARIRLQADIKFVTAGSAEILLRRSAGGTHNSVRLDAANQTIVMWVNGHSYSLPFALGTGVWYTVKAEANGTNVKLYVNGTLAMERNDFPEEGTIAGLASSGGHVRFDNVSATQINDWDRDWDSLVNGAKFVKEGAERLDYGYYEFPLIGLGGTTFFAGPTGFTKPDAPGKDMTYHNFAHIPAILYDYWWHADTKRVMPFQLNGGYGTSASPNSGAIDGSVWKQTVDVRTGLMTTALRLTAGSQTFDSSRSAFVNPDGVLVMKVEDSVSHTFRLQVGRTTNADADVASGYGAIYDNYAISYDAITNGLVAKNDYAGTTERMTLAVSASGQGVSVDTAGGTISATVGPGQPAYFYFAPGSSLKDADPVTAAANKAQTAAGGGYANLAGDTAAWWDDFWGKSKVDIPDLGMANWYIRSLYYHGAMIGNSEVPPGAYGTNPDGFDGAVLPEFDLVYSHFAMLYSNHADVSKGMTDWYERMLPNAEAVAADPYYGYPSGSAKYAWLMGYNAKPIQNPGLEQGWRSDFPGGNVAAMVLSQKTFTNADLTSAKALLQKVTKAQLAHQVYFDKWQGYAHSGVWSPTPWDPNALHPGDGNQSTAAIWSIRQAQKYGVSNATWDALLPQLLDPFWYNSQTGADMTLLAQPFWWMQTHDIMSPEALATYLNVAATQMDYTFNQGWASVLASKLHLADEALRTVKLGLKNSVHLYDDISMVETHTDGEDYKKAPEIGAHGAYVAAIDQMLLDGDSDTEIRVFPGVAQSWLDLGVGFEDLRTNGGILVSGTYDEAGISVTLQNTDASASRTRTVYIRVPDGATTATDAGGLAVLGVDEGNFAKLNVTLDPGASRTIALTASAGTAQPGAFDILLPKQDAAQVGAVNPRFGWNWSDGAASYKLKVSKRADLSNPLFDQNVGRTIQYALNRALEPGVRYYWQVTAVNAGGSVANAGGIRTFTTYGEPVDDDFSAVRYLNSYWSGSGWPAGLNNGQLEVRAVGTDQNFIVQPGAKGNFTATAKMTYLPSQSGQQAGLVVRLDEQHYLKFVRKSDGGAKYVLGGAGVSGGVGSYADPHPTAQTVYLRIVKQDDTIRAYESVDNQAYTQIGGDAVAALGAEFGVGFIASSAGAANENTYAAFDWFQYQKRGMNDEFAGRSLETAWAPTGAYTVDGGKLNLIVPANEGFAEHRVLRTMAGSDYVLTTKLDYKPAANYMQGGLLIWQDATHYVKLSRTYNSGNTLEFAGPTLSGGMSVADPVPGSTIYLRLQKNGNVYTASYSADGAAWTGIGSGTATLTSPKAGVAAGSFSAASGSVPFDWFHVETMDDAFDGTALAGKWSASGTATVSGGKLQIGIAASSNDDTGKVVQTAASEDLSLTAKVDYKPAQNYQQAGVLIWYDATHYIKVDRQFNGGGRLEFSGQGLSGGASVADPVPGGTIYLRLDKAGYYYRAYYSADGDYWTPIGGYGSSTASGQAKVGVAASSFSAATGTAAFDWFRAS